MSQFPLTIKVAFHSDKKSPGEMDHAGATSKLLLLVLTHEHSLTVSVKDK
ncbi:hypothetical protein Brsp01_07290 [Brucella sp. NBRC 12950]|nr:hypothetical protein Brsp01_07290 [Brucella sp. NBRC 12950]